MFSGMLPVALAILRAFSFWATRGHYDFYNSSRSFAMSTAIRRAVAGEQATSTF